MFGSRRRQAFEIIAPAEPAPLPGKCSCTHVANAYRARPESSQPTTPGPGAASRLSAFSQLVAQAAAEPTPPPPTMNRPPVRSGSLHPPQFLGRHGNHRWDFQQDPLSNMTFHVLVCYALLPTSVRTDEPPGATACWMYCHMYVSGVFLISCVICTCLSIVLLVLPRVNGNVMCRAAPTAACGGDTRRRYAQRARNFTPPPCVLPLISS